MCSSNISSISLSLSPTPILHLRWSKQQRKNDKKRENIIFEVQTELNHDTNNYYFTQTPYKQQNSTPINAKRFFILSCRVWLLLTPINEILSDFKELLTLYFFFRKIILRNEANHSKKTEKTRQLKPYMNLMFEKRKRSSFIKTKINYKKQNPIDTMSLLHPLIKRKAYIGQVCTWAHLDCFASFKWE